MKIKTIILLFIVTASCDDKDSGVRFESPQPEGQRNEQSIPKKIIGTYRAIADSAILTITSKLITKTFKTRYSGLISEIDSSERIKFKNDTSFSNVDGNVKFGITFKGDSAFENVDYTDTLFSFSKSNVLRKFKGYYFLSHESGPNRWIVTKIGMTKDGLILGTISDQEDLKNLRELTNVKSDTVYKFRPTRKQLKHFIRDKGFQNEERFVKSNTAANKSYRSVPGKL